MTVDVLLFGSGSGVVESTIAVFVIVPAAEGFTLPLMIRVKESLASKASNS
ncbi:hypothetical protein D3C85_1872920 [compost metagenome]